VYPPAAWGLPGVVWPNPMLIDPGSASVPGPTRPAGCRSAESPPSRATPRFDHWGAILRDYVSQGAGEESEAAPLGPSSP
jgi:hypothetical protein